MRQVWELFAKEKLMKYRAKKAALRSIQDEIRQLESASTSIRSVTSDSQPLKGGGNKREDVMLNNISMRQELEKNLAEARTWIYSVDAAMDSLSEEEKKILDKSFINPEKNSVDRLCHDLGYEKTTIYKKRDTALYHFTLALYGRSEA